MSKNKWVKRIVALALVLIMAAGMMPKYTKKTDASGTYTITFNTNGGWFESKDRQYPVNQNGKDYSKNYYHVIGAGSLTSIPKIVPYWNGYRFLGWSTSKNATSATYTSGQGSVRFNGNVTLYAVWKPYIEISEDRKASLDYPSFVSLIEDQWPEKYSYGADQGYSQYTDSEKIIEAYMALLGTGRWAAETYIANCTCGTFAAINTALYAKGYKARNTTPAKVENEVVDYYKNNVDDWGRRLSNGESPKNIKTYMTWKGFKSVTWKRANDRETVYKDLVNMIENHDNPVIMSFHAADSDLGLDFYYLENHRLKKSMEDVTSHYFVVTAVYRDPVRPNDIWLKVSSWGQYLYISWTQYSTYKSNNILYGDYVNGYITFVR